MIVDAHLHLFLTADADPERPVDEIAPAEREATLQLLEATMSSHDVGAAVVVPLGKEEAYVSGVVATAPERFRGIAVWDGETDPGRVAERLDRGGFTGLRMFGFGDRVPPWAVLQRLEADGKVLWLYPAPGDLTAADEVARRLESLVVVLNHTGFVQAGIGVDDRGRPRVRSVIPQPTEAASIALAARPNVFVILSGAYGFSHQPWPYPDVGAVTARVAGAFGPQRLMWASDFPWILEDPGYGATLALVDHHLPGLSPTERAGVMGLNARRLLWGEG